MPCYHPLIRYEDKTKYITAADGHKYHPAQINRPFDRKETLEYTTQFHGAGLIPCGKCIGCRLEYAKEWANRGYLESKLYDDNFCWFVTLTYDDNNLVTEWKDEKEGISNSAVSGTLVPRHFTRFMHDLRQIMERRYNRTGIRFMGCGEYGDEKERPHYHVILFNCYLPSDTFYEPRLINKEFYFRNTIIEEAWKKGISNISECTWNTINYTARYITKKVNGKESWKHYAEKGIYPEFMRVSRMPGIAKPYYDLHKEDIYKTDSIWIKNKAGIVQCKPPKYFDYLYEKECPEHWKRIQADRKRAERNQENLINDTHSYMRLEYKAIQERTVDEKTAKLIRILENNA